tara:strand:+ start:962 stop:1282 length:321 start_codon:yes stop_codon:yes gene_type:complete
LSKNRAALPLPPWRAHRRYSLATPLTKARPERQFQGFAQIPRKFPRKKQRWFQRAPTRGRAHTNIRSRKPHMTHIDLLAQTGGRLAIAFAASFATISFIFSSLALA